jgi:putative DNA primase/helicase
VSTEYANTVAAGIIRQLREGTAPWIRQWVAGQRYLPHNPISGHQYHGINMVWLMVKSQERGYADTRWMTYRQAVSAGAHVRRGEKGTTIQYWKWEDTRPVLDGSGASRLDESGSPLTERIEYTRPRVFTAIVFNAEQIEGLAAASVDQQPPEWDRHEKAESILTASGVRIEHLPQEHAYYSVQRDSIVLPLRSQFPTADGYYAVAIHEVGHATGHASRLNRDLGHPFGSELYAREELRAEIASLMLGDQLGIGHDPGQHVAYIGSWIKVLEDDPLEVFRAAAAAEKIQAYVLGMAEQRVVEQEQARVQAVSRGQDVDKDLPASTITRQHESLVDPRQEFANALRAAGLVLEQEPLMDGVLHRVRVEEDSGRQRSGAYVGYLDGHPAGFIQNYKTGHRANWKSQSPSQKLNASDIERLRMEAEQRQQQRRDERLRKQREVARAVGQLLLQTSLASDSFPYLVRKGFADNQHKLHIDDAGNLLLPARDIDGQVWSIQRISPSGRKLNEPGGRMEGCHLLLMGEQSDIRFADLAGLYVSEMTLIVAESYTTGRTLERASGLPVAITFSSGNILRVAKAYRKKFPHLNIIVAGDNDHRKPLELDRNGHPKRNVGKEKAEEAAHEVSGYPMLPPFAPEELGSDWNDLEQTRGLDAARALIRTGIEVALVHIHGQQIAAGLGRFPVHHSEEGRRCDPELGYVSAQTREQAREKLVRGEWVATVNRAIISIPLLEVFDSDTLKANQDEANAQRIIERDRLLLLDSRTSGHDGESVAETVRSDDAAAQRTETPIRVRASLDSLREAAEGEADRQAVHDQQRERRHARSR